MERRASAFTLLEMLVSFAVSMALMALLLLVVENVSRAVRLSAGTAAAFDEARLALADIRRQLGQATLAPYWAVSYTSEGNPSGYHRQSDLHFIVGAAAGLLPETIKTSGHAIFFQTPAGFEPTQGGSSMNQLGALGYYVEFRDANADFPVDSGELSMPMRKKWSFQLREFRQPAGALKVMDPGMSGDAWLRSAFSGGDPPVSALAGNVALILFRVRLADDASEGQFYHYDSRHWNGSGLQPKTSHQLPATIDVVLLALDEATAIRIGEQGDGAMPVLPVQELFADASRFDDDLVELEARMAARWPGAGFRILRGSVAIRAAKWSLDPTAPPEEEAP